MKSFRREAKVFKAFCDENRLEILKTLRSRERCACEILEELEIAQSTLSHHMKILCESGVVSSRKEGKWTHYKLDKEGGEKALALLEQFLNWKGHNEADKKKNKGCDCK